MLSFRPGTPQGTRLALSCLICFRLILLRKKSDITVYGNGNIPISSRFYCILYIPVPNRYFLGFQVRCPKASVRVPKAVELGGWYISGGDTEVMQDRMRSIGPGCVWADIPCCFRSYPDTPCDWNSFLDWGHLDGLLYIYSSSSPIRTTSGIAPHKPTNPITKPPPNTEHPMSGAPQSFRGLPLVPGRVAPVLPRI